MGEWFCQITMWIILLISLGNSQNDLENFFGIETRILPNREDLHANVQFFLYTRSFQDDPKQLFVEDDASYEEFVADKETQIFIHGWLCNRKWFYPAKNALLEQKNYNVIIVDWGWLAFNRYFEASNLTVPVGEYTALLVDSLVTNKDLKLSDVHIVGHSFGAHIAGIIGNRIKTGTLARITGLDAARVPHKSDEVPLENKLDPSDAECVQVVHTASGHFGMDVNIGHADYYPNGGAEQPECNYLDLAYASCSHLIVLKYHEHWCKNPEIYEAVECEEWEDYDIGACSQNNKVFMVPDIGTECPNGTYYVRT